MPQVFGLFEEPRGPGEDCCSLNSGLLKPVISELFQAKLSQVPPNVHLAELNPHLDLKQDRFAVKVKSILCHPCQVLTPKKCRGYPLSI